MSSSKQDLQKHVGRNRHEARKELESQGYTVHEVRTGSFATGYVPAKVMRAGEHEQEKRAVISYNGDDPEEKVTHISQD